MTLYVISIDDRSESWEPILTYFDPRLVAPLYLLSRNRTCHLHQLKLSLPEIKSRQVYYSAPYFISTLQISK